MPIDLILPTSISLSLIAWTLIFRWYIDPLSKHFGFEQVLQPLLILHAFRYIGLMFLIPGVTSEPLDPRFAHPAAYGDLIAALMALGALATLRLNLKGAIPIVWLFNIFGLADLINAVARGMAFTIDGHLGAAYWIPTTLVPMYLVSHIYIFILLRRHSRALQIFPS